MVAFSNIELLEILVEGLSFLHSVIEKDSSSCIAYFSGEFLIGDC